jgi:hypothetical protein
MYMRMMMRASPAVLPATVPARAGVLKVGDAVAAVEEAEGGGRWVVMTVPWMVVVTTMSFGCDEGVACWLLGGAAAAEVGWSTPLKEDWFWAGLEGGGCAGAEGKDWSAVEGDD